MVASSQVGGKQSQIPDEIISCADVEAMVGQHHVFFFADGPEELTEELVMDKIKKSAGESSHGRLQLQERL